MGARAWLNPAIVASYPVGAARSLRRRWIGPRRWPGDARAICAAVIERCWNGEYLAASGGHFRQFWTRDLGFSAGALVRLGQGERVVASLAWALETWKARRHHITTTVFGGRRPADVYAYGIDSLPLFLWALRLCGAGDLVARHGGWLRDEVRWFAEVAVDRRTGLARTDRDFSGHRDTVRRRGTCHAAVMVALLAREARLLDLLPRPLGNGDPSARLVEAYWRGDHFADAPEGPGVVSGEANVWPFWTGVVDDVAMLGAALGVLRRAGLDRPLPLRYVARREAAIEAWPTRLLLPDYQGTSVWTSLGAIYLQLEARVDPAAAARDAGAYVVLVEREGTFWEVLDGSGRPFRGRYGLYHADEGMLWSAIFLDALEGIAPAPSG